MGEVFGEGNVTLFHQSKDIVSGDFYWAKEVDGKRIIAVGDCTGHGVPGAMLAMIGDSLLSNIVLGKGITEPAMILDALQHYFRNTLKGNNNMVDGMDIAIAKINTETQKLHFAGARNPITYFQNGEEFTIKGDKTSIGHSKLQFNTIKKFTSHKIDVSVPTTFYLYSDGYQDQFGGENKRKFYSKNLRYFFEKIQHVPLTLQGELLQENFEEWRKDTKQTDDVTVVGIHYNALNEKGRGTTEISLNNNHSEKQTKTA
jgi:serine phosphatase RsbU (regulator of sigma subunit)